MHLLLLIGIPIDAYKTIPLFQAAIKGTGTSDRCYKKINREVNSTLQSVNETNARPAVRGEEASD